jgi:D-alanyl-lipoteichoic acid acyltransferase DltB (MBOAT superfamily)
MNPDIATPFIQPRPSGDTFGRAFVPVVGKLALSAAGVAFLGQTSGTLSAPLLLTCTALLGFMTVRAVDLMSSMRLRRLIGRFVVPLAFILLVLLNVTGWIGTLTGSDQATSFRNLSLVAAPFYLLSIAAVIADVANKRMRAPGALDFFTYVALPFKLLAGPLEPPAFIRQLQKWQPRFSLTRVTAAWPWLALGTVMKFVIGNRLNPAITLGSTHPTAALLTAAIFELKFYFDFAGYSFIGYGGALLFGFRMSRNFMHPFLAPNVVLFWRRWHMSLGRFLARYLLEPNVGKIKGRPARMIFTSAIFLVSAMWHGGTGNYALWGLFHGTCYFLWISRLKHWSFPRPVGIVAMICFFILGRFLAIEAQFGRLLEKLANLFDPRAWAYDFTHMRLIDWPVLDHQVSAIAVAAIFMVLEIWSVRQYGVGRSYHLMRRSYAALFMLILCLFFAIQQGGLLYARL